MPNRIIREAILGSEKVARLTWPDEVFYRRLMSIVDDYGRHEANPQLLRAKCYPLQTDAVRVTDISRWLAACQMAGLILNYAVQGKQYVEVLNFQQQQRSASKCPEPPANAQQLIADATQPIANDSKSEQLHTQSYSYPYSESGTAPPSSRGARLSLAAAPDEWVEFCRKERKDLDPVALFAQFRDYWIAQPGTKGVKTDWFATWRNWVRRDNGRPAVKHISTNLPANTIPI